MDELVYLVKINYEPDDIGQMVPHEKMRPVWATIQSVTRAEWRDGGQQGLQPQLMIVMPIVNYEGEQIVQIGDGENAKRYGVYRTYLPNDSDTIELYLEKKAGVYAKSQSE